MNYYTYQDSPKIFTDLHLHWKKYLGDMVSAEHSIKLVSLPHSGNHQQREHTIIT